MLGEATHLAQYHSQDADTRLVIDTLSIYIYPLDKYTLLNALNAVRPLPQNRAMEILQQLGDEKLVKVNMAGNYYLTPALSFLLFPTNIRRPEYLRLLEDTGIRANSFYSSSARLQELQQLLTAFFTGDRSLLLQPIRKIAHELEEYQPYLQYLLYYPAYEGLLQLFDREDIARIYVSSTRQQLLQMPPLAQLQAQGKHLGQFPVPELLLLEGNFNAIPQAEAATADELYAQAVAHLYDGKPDLSFSTFTQGLKLQRQLDKKNSIPANPLFAFYYALALILLPESQSSALLPKITAAYEKKLQPGLTPAICLLLLHGNRKEKAEQLLEVLLENCSRQGNLELPAYLSIIALQLYQPKGKLLKKYTPQAHLLMRLGMERHYRLLTYEYLYLFREEDYLGYGKEFSELAAHIAKAPVLSQLRVVPEWERQLNALLMMEERANGKDRPAITTRLAYLVNPDKLSITPVLQALQGDAWVTGKQVSLKHLHEGRVECMTEQDRRMAAMVMKVAAYTHFGDTWSFEDRVWLELAGHPYLFLEEDATVPVEVVKGLPEVTVNSTGGGYAIHSNIANYNRDLVILQETYTRLKVIPLTARQRMLLQQLQQIGIVPAAGKEKLQQALRQIGAHLTIHSDLDGPLADTRKIKADNRIVVQLQPMGDALRATFYVKPFTQAPPYCRPGLGARNIIGALHGERCQALRDMEAEQANLARLLELVQAAVTQEVEDDTIIFEDQLDCLYLLEIIQQHPELAVAEWPEGAHLKVRQQAGLHDLHISVSTKARWFECDGALQVDEATVLSLKELLDATQHTRRRFVQLKNGDFIALTSTLRNRLEELASIALAAQQGVKVQRAAGHMLEGLLQQAGSAGTDEGWKKFSREWQQAGETTVPIPAGLQATLRPYQEEGFRWMARLAAWGAGACLADDMGLGKTIQSIALLLHRAQQGPALVVCPASVLPNWAAELSRFAPSLQIQLPGNGNRYQQLHSAAAGDVVLVTYGLLQSERALFAGVHWSTVVLDEAHVIKNHQTKTSKAAMALQADFRLILTGTPIQNHLTEIWNLFNFINPGLLGTLPWFREQFATPVAHNPDSSVKKHLSRLIAPFMLRRTKAGILDELPPKTEITRTVRLSPEEASFYEALRLKAVENIRKYGGLHNKQNLNTLTEITRLRMAACHPQLIDTSLNIPSSKLAAFLEIVEELKENKHRALVFSQFVKHLDLVRQALDGLGVPYLYLDGSTPIDVRESRVKKFQSGEGMLFLISLKAGGLGLNLTAADYVVHLDPWWNPAVEEQASDRAYRIGQTRPVTIYRLITAHTIEEKIVALHNRKRELAEDLLSAGDTAGRLSATELLDLITGA